MPMRITGMNSGLDTESMVQELVSAYKKKGEKTTKEKTKLEWKQNIWQDLNKKVKAFNKKVQNLKYSSSFNIKKTTSSNESKATVIAGENAPKGTQKLKINQLAQSTYITSGEVKKAGGGKVTGDTTLRELGLNVDGGKIILQKNNGADPVEIDANQDTKVSDIVQNLKAAGIDANFDEATGRFFLNAKESGRENGFSLSWSGGQDVLEVLHLRPFGGEGADQGATVIEAKDAEIELNGAKFTSKNNNFNINGLTITAKETTGKDEVITLSTDADTEGIYNQIKDLIKEYSSLINELDKLYNADVAKGYEPLTDDEKDAMSDKEIEKWEDKIKESLLRRDSNISSISSAMKQSALKSYKVGDKEFTLADFGIGTLGYFNSADNEKNALHIDGDADDADVSSKTNKLKKMIADDPDAVAGFFSAFLTELGDRFTKLSESSSSRSYGNFFDDKKVASDLTRYEKKVSDWEEYVARIEDKYYRQFSKMETQLAKLQSTQSSLANYFGGGS